MSSALEGVVKTSAKNQVTINRVSGAVWVFLGAIFVVTSLFVKGKAGEENIRVVAGCLGAVSVAFGIAYANFTTKRTGMLVDLLLNRRSELKGALIIRRQRNGMILGYSIAVSDSANRRYRMVAPSEDGARLMLANIPA